jgi:hypothetical protein
MSTTKMSTALTIYNPKNANSQTINKLITPPFQTINQINNKGEDTQEGEDKENKLITKEGDKENKLITKEGEDKLITKEEQLLNQLFITKAKKWLDGCYPEGEEDDHALEDPEGDLHPEEEVEGTG